MWKRRQQNRPGRLPAVGDTSPADTTLGGVPYGGVQTSFMNFGTSPQGDGPHQPPVRPTREAPKGLPGLPL
jgi:hypothetical protein